MTTTRCGMSDMNNGIDFDDLFVESVQLHVRLRRGHQRHSAAAEFQAVRNAFATWAGVVNFTFTEVAPNANPDILIGWRPANDPDHNMVGGILAHADFPPAARS